MHLLGISTAIFTKNLRRQCTTIAWWCYNEWIFNIIDDQFRLFLAQENRSKRVLEKLILYFVCKTKGHITKIQLVKFLYLADLYAVKWTGSQLTDLDWRYYKYGPWHEAIDIALAAQLADVIILQEENNATMIRLKDESWLTADLGFSQGLELMLDNIRKEWAGAGADKIQGMLDYVYSTAPMVEAQHSHVPEDKAILNLQLEREKLVEELGV
jgi:uncharacterized phage-associated protein